MNTNSQDRLTTLTTAMVLIACSTGAILGAQASSTSGRFAALAIADSSSSIDVALTPPASLPPGDKVRAGWEQFLSEHGKDWSIYLDRRSGAPQLVEGQGIKWPAGRDTSMDGLAASVREFIAGHRALLLADDAELVLNKEASGLLNPDTWQVVFDRVVSGIPVEGERYLFTIGHGNLILFGTPRWSRIDASPFPDLDGAEAQARLVSYMQLTAADGIDVFEKPKLLYIPLRAGGPAAAGDGAYSGAVGAGYESALVWRVGLTVAGVTGTWEALVDAHTGAVRSFQDTNAYAFVKGGVYPLSNDQHCPEGCEQPNFPMPFADVVSYSPTVTATTSGLFDCSPVGNLVGTKLVGKYSRIGSQCGLVLQSGYCDTDLDMGVSPGTDCALPPGITGGDTHAARTAFYHLTRINEKVRPWLPEVGWLTTRFDAQVDSVFDPDRGDCVSFFQPFFGQSVNYAVSDNTCNNLGENAGVLAHEWGHALDYNDGGGVDSPSEAYADITSMLSTHVSCMGRGALKHGTCTGFGNACLSCTGFRELDWDKRAAHAPSTPGGFVATRCPVPSSGQSGPCGKDPFCEGYLGGETIWDLAVRDLPASGLDEDSSWQLVDRLWFTSRFGSGGPAWTCSLPNASGCAAVAWFTKMRVVDDDDGNLANGTPHAAAIFAAFNRHGIACETAASPSNQNTSTCPAFGAPQLSSSLGNGFAALSWSPIANASGYRVLKNEIGCHSGSAIVATIPGTTYTDTGLINGVTGYYRVQPVLANTICEGLVSNCEAVTPQPFAGFVKLDAAAYSCTGLVHVTVSDANIGAGTTTVSLTSTTETSPETVTLTQIAPGSDTYTGTIALTGAAPAPDGVLSVANGDVISANYIDASDGGGGVNIPRFWTSSADCAAPVISKVQATNITGSNAEITWTTNEPATSAVHSGVAPPPGTTTAAAASVTGHEIQLSGLAECTPYIYSVGSVDVVGNLATDDASGNYYAFTTGKTTQPTFVDTDTPIAIPDNNPTGATSIIVVPDARTVQDVNVTIDVQHTFDSDLTFTLITPTGIEITLASGLGDRDDNYTGTVFDDEAATSINDAAAPFTGTFRPASPLSAADGSDAAGAWGLKAVDHIGQDVGSILDWSLQLTYATPSCGPHAVLRSQARVADTCVTGGIGHANTYWDAGENVQFKVNVANDGTTTLTGVTATVSSTTPGVALLDATASLPNIPAGGAADTLAPHFMAHLPTTLACGGTVAFDVAIHSDQGSYSGSFVQQLGRPTNGTGRVLDEGFSTGIPATWTVVDGGFGGGAAKTWTATNPGVRTIAAPMFLPVATVDSDAAGPVAVQDESLLTPPFNLSTATAATLQFDEFFNWFAGNSDEFADVDVRSSLTGGAWVNVLHQHGASSANPAHEAVDISAQAAGAADAQVRFRNWNGANEEFWQLDNVTIDASAPGSCDMPVCSLPTPGGAKPVADGIFGIPMKASRGDATASTIAVTWDVATCASADQHILYGNLGSVASLTVLGAACNLGTSGTATWSGVPAGNLWFVVVGDDNATKEGTWGTDGIGGQRGGTTASGQCGTVTRDNSGVCP